MIQIEVEVEAVVVAYLVGTDVIIVSTDVHQQMLQNINMKIMKRWVLSSKFKDLKEIRHRE